ncbi:hypothetical protein KSC_067980 [Ktedonobacter sp. SOSP1-52]|uniref:ATP-binding protein n=1 Tax=Ktedonobacter sp. SOSP1-52 TaxID=2778366 RepID=UPI001915D8F3|nr:ATP-binding protein [Ktedonobacter sp. SOSP1-52]GHO67906.1 hypothetical protein KSC_067980 [Ktedonobacter sp. SOSP1-52]
MKRIIEQLLFLKADKGQKGQLYIIDSCLGILSSLAVTLCLYLLRLYPTIPNVSLIYLLIVLVLASTRGLYAATVASVVAFLSFDYFLVPPFYTFSIAKSEEWLALFIFLVTAIFTGQLAAALRQRAQQATMRESETRALYELVSATTNEASMERQLQVVAQAVVREFASSGVRDCAILLPNEKNQFVLHADVKQTPGTIMELVPDEQVTAMTAMREGKVIDLHSDALVSARDPIRYWYRRRMDANASKRGYIRMLPLMLGQRSVGVVRLLMNEDPQQFMLGTRARGRGEQLSQRAAFFWTFMDQAAAVIDRARLRRESMQVELLRRTDALRSALLSSVSHDLRTPLASIKAAASSLLQEDVSWGEEERAGFIQAIERQADRLNRLVGNLLDMSRIEGGALHPEKEWYPIDELIHDVLGHMQTTLDGREIRTSLPEDLPPVQIDYLQLDQVVTNLLENAARYTSVGSPIEISVEVMDENMLVSIGDYGPGIPPGDLERIFDKFYRVSGTRRSSSSTMGTGLGLAVCRGLIEAHGGRIWAENRLEGGAIFRFTLPLTKGEELDYA